ncbi:radical S-adenosyl methionine domain-containing protein 1, mitochondrial [Dorcoceras hygrometricum]|uniref:Radical S-adenosyl methionine domain-containing protein 1, mitochondrial n=1 Tax=Dorcoceras hygrometricum TaxID=472368 RepID=A0A2Z7CP55_9LAMI|nr:radical S-adenosyl methionine domain-containing protein 1, mitochondrial [Dorcoceras hygrometricum]
MLLKSTFPPQFLAAIPTKTKFRRLRFNSSLTQECSETVRQAASSPLLLHKLPPTSAYVHLPFCRKRCHYCDFPIIALGSSSTMTNDDDPRMSTYVETVCREIKSTKLDASNNHPCLETIFFGGGTPSLVPPRLVFSVLEALSSKFGVCSGAEISIEMDPGTFDEAKMKELMDLGVNRVSLGVQAFQEELLKACGRAHGLNEVYEAVEIIKSCGVENWSLDLISSLPHQTPDMWKESLRLTVQALPTHVSVYDLQVEKDTKFGMLYTPGEFPLPSENQSAEYYKMASRMLKDAGYDHYEISSYCKSGYRCKHNSIYWKNKSFYGFGLGSASHIGGIRFSRPRSLKEYTFYVQNLENGLVTCSVNDKVDAKETAMDIIMLSLRTSDGLNLKSFRDAFGGSLVLSICEVYKRYVESGHVICVDNRGRDIPFHEFNSLLTNDQRRNEELASIRLSDPEGFLLSSELISLAFGVVTP